MISDMSSMEGDLINWDTSDLNYLDVTPVLFDLGATSETHQGAQRRQKEQSEPRVVAEVSSQRYNCT